MSAAPLTWSGWWRRGPGEAWQKLVEAEDLGTCHRRLLRAAAARPKVRNVDLFMTADGANPMEAAQTHSKGHE
jgi:hypothetical protein